MLAAGMAKDWDIRIVPERVIPDLREADGVTDEQIETMMVRNPVAWLSGLATGAQAASACSHSAR